MIDDKDITKLWKIVLGVFFIVSTAIGAVLWIDAKVETAVNTAVRVSYPNERGMALERRLDKTDDQLRVIETQQRTIIQQLGRLEGLLQK